MIRFVTTSRAAELLDMTRHGVVKAIYRGDLKGIKLEGSKYFLIPIEEISKFNPAKPGRPKKS